MNRQVCKWFKSLWFHFPDELKNDENYNFVYGDQTFKRYCTNNSCDNNLEKINAACLYLFNAFFVDYNSFKDNAKNNIDVVYYIIIWLSYMLSLKENGINKLNDFYTKHIETNMHYKNKIYGVSAYNCYKEIIDQKRDLLDINNNIISNFYKAFKSLYEMYYAFDGSTSNCTKCLNKANQFVEEYKELNENSNNTDNSPYRKILSTLSSDYNNLKNECKNAQDINFPNLPEIKTTQPSVECSDDNSAQKSEQTVKSSEEKSEQTVKSSEETSEQIVQSSDFTSSSSSIVSKVIPVLSIFAAIPIFLGISYKYSLFGFRKRSQKHLRKKLKK
ncbi:PIR protein [Plasmodium yoelii]|uniref:PIR protein n=2 Tax=Plasmodium yoelii TaxID=5861 RepID=A0AAE9WQC6_PLAYO|nr:PIR protein [Plasmodium yoelii]WBY55127.1 PIR protein [Plasmodium yoelii yoelii]CDS44162.1 YIR protein [Plasmodium yoelii]VTZ72717.1 PIR protein [Plasmodium yoelii]|eukprot:XP_034493363.1 PIR protein [Plasmodium yoelii]